MKAGPLPSRKLLLYLFRYDGKRLFWKNPPKNKRFLIGREAATRCGGYLVVKVEGRLYKVHRIIFKMKTGREPPQIDHNNRKRDDNTWGNILASTNLKNHRNRTNTKFPDMPPGVDPWRGRYRALGWNRDEKKTVYLGMFDSKAKAARAARDHRESRGW